MKKYSKSKQTKYSGFIKLGVRLAELDISFDESQFDDFFLLIKFIVMPNMPNQIFWKCPQRLLQDGALPKRDCLARVLGGPNAPTWLGFSSLKIGMCIVQVNDYEIVVKIFHITWHDIQHVSINLPEFTHFVQLMNWKKKTIHVNLWKKLRNRSQKE